MASKYYKSNISGLEVVVGDPDTSKGEVAPQVVRFTPYLEKFQGDNVKVGYLETDNAVAIAALKDDPNAQEIQKDEYDKATGKDSTELGT